MHLQKERLVWECLQRGHFAHQSADDCSSSESLEVWKLSSMMSSLSLSQKKKKKGDGWFKMALNRESRAAREKCQEIDREQASAESDAAIKIRS